MGLIRAAAGAVSGTLADSWLEYITAGDMGANTVLTRGVQIKRGKHGSNTKGTPDIISNGSRIEVDDDSGGQRPHRGLHCRRGLL